MAFETPRQYHKGRLVLSDILNTFIRKGWRSNTPVRLMDAPHLQETRGASRWRTPDALRQSFASYHLAYFRNYQALQYETGHRSSDLLCTRHVDMESVTDAAGSWQGHDLHSLKMGEEFLFDLTNKGKGR